ncbi:MAG: methyltransferase domain-containing protein [Gemmatales bacterium]|nr:methyltransferase domain-containing protein [Gemmatales bacterium]
MEAKPQIPRTPSPPDPIRPQASETVSRLRAEIAFHEAQAAARRRYFTEHPEELLVQDDAYLDHESWVRFAFDLLGDVSGKAVLDYGCGHGMAAVILARRGAQVTAFDLCGGYVAEAQQRAEANAVADRIDFVQAAGERLPFRDGSFDAVWGHAVLHHLDLEPACRELVRVLKPGGTAVFCEPWGGNPLLEWARRRCRYPGKERTRDERPLQPNDLAEVRRHFRETCLYPQQLLGMLGRIWPRLPCRKFLHRCDQSLLTWFPSLGRFSRYLVLSLRN